MPYFINSEQKLTTQKAYEIINLLMKERYCFQTSCVWISLRFYFALGKWYCLNSWHVPGASLRL